MRPYGRAMQGTQRNYERYVVTNNDKGLLIELRQRRNVVAMAVVMAAALAGLLVVSPWGPAPVAVITRELTTLTAAVLGVFLGVAIVALFYKLEAVLLKDQFVFKDSFGMKGGVPIRRKLRVRVVISSGRNRSAFPFALQILEEDGQVSKLKFDFAQRATLLALVERMRTVVQVEIVDVLRVRGMKVESVGMAALKD